MTFNSARASLAASAALAIILAVAAAPASAQTKTWPAGTDCAQLVGNDKTDCANQSKNTNSPDNSNNPDAGSNSTGAATTGSSGTDNTMPTSNSTKNYKGSDCTALVGNEKDECSHQNKQTGEPDNSNNPAQSEPAQSN